MENLVEKISIILFLYNEPITLEKLKSFLDDEQSNLDSNIKSDINIETINIAILDLKDRLENIGLTIIKKNNPKEEKSEISISTKKELEDIVKIIKKDEISGELTPASLQVLTICAYLGNLSKNDISFIRGVQSSQSIRSLSARGLLKKDNDKYSLSIQAIQSLGLNKLEDLYDYENIKKDFEERLKEVLKEEE